MHGPYLCNVLLCGTYEVYSSNPIQFDASVKFSKTPNPNARYRRLNATFNHDPWKNVACVPSTINPIHSVISLSLSFGYTVLK